jgi:hypothetical protein
VRCNIQEQPKANTYEVEFHSTPNEGRVATSTPMTIQPVGNDSRLESLA